jgi:hypothetical protein
VTEPDPTPQPETQPEPAVTPPAPAHQESHTLTADWMDDQPPEAPQAEPEPLPTHKDDLVAVAIDRGVPSYEAWDMTVPQLTKRLKG